MSTPHIAAEPGAIAPIVLMPGDPRRAAYIAEHFLDGAVEFNRVRNMLGFSGAWRGKPVSVLGSGMGIPSLSIYARELVTEYGVRTIIRVGSCGALQPKIELQDVVLATAAGTDSAVNRLRSGGYELPAVPSFELAMKAFELARERDLPCHAGTVFSTDLFYHPDRTLNERLLKLGVLALEMEAAGLYGLAAALDFQALAICTVSDHVIRGEQLSPEARERSFHSMIELALDTALP